MIGGDTEIVQRLEPIFAALAPGIDAAPRTRGRTGHPTSVEHGYLHCGPPGAGHFVKMVHNGIEYGVMAAYAEGINILRHANAGEAGRDRDAETAPLEHPELYRYDFDIAAIAELWRRCGSMVETMDAATHDKVVAIVSHLPHLIAFTICGTADDLAEETREAVLKFAASGFRDFTRIAASDVDMWRDIFLNNREALLEMLARFSEDAHALGRAVRWGQAEFIEDRIRRGRGIRRGLIERKQA